ncbi:MAG: hypothetical protein OIF57_09385 [Marinobacterium sp.]|nr:hypothetical protein [Marinobacterium sp.]
MKIVFSRKGFDSSAGGIASPILPDGTLLPLPIPQQDGPLKFSQLKFQGQSLSSMISQLGGKDWRGRCHLDPDLDITLTARPDNWQPAFGQSGSAQRHLEQEGVQPGDLFLFFGWFRQTERVRGQLRFVRGAPDLHILHSWLQIGQILPVTAALTDQYSGLHQHPHMQKDYPFNTLYLPVSELSIDGIHDPLPGSGMFHYHSDCHQLTWPGEQRSVWKLPICFAPENCVQVLSYHRKPARWRTETNFMRLEAAYRGQEFVVCSADYTGQQRWLQQLFSYQHSITEAVTLDFSPP